MVCSIMLAGGFTSSATCWRMAPIHLTLIGFTCSRGRYRLTVRPTSRPDMSRGGATGSCRSSPPRPERFEISFLRWPSTGFREGIDGWRLDVPTEIDDDEFWREFRRRVKAINPEAYIVGEIWHESRRWLQGDQFDGVQNYLFTKACLGFLAAQSIDWGCIDGTGLQPLNTLDAEGFRGTIDWTTGLYPWPITQTQLNQLDSHDTARFVTIASGDVQAFRLATLMQMTYPGAPCVYYGDEIGMRGGHEPGSRGSFPWNQDEWNHDLAGYVKRCIALRRDHSVFRRGDFISLYGQDEVYAFARRDETEVAVVILNASQDARTVDRLAVPDTTLRDFNLVFGETPPNLVDGEIGDWRVPPRSGAVVLSRRS